MRTITICLLLFYASVKSQIPSINEKRSNWKNKYYEFKIEPNSSKYIKPNDKQITSLSFDEIRAHEKHALNTIEEHQKKIKIAFAEMELEEKWDESSKYLASIEKTKDSVADEKDFLRKLERTRNRRFRWFPTIKKGARIEGIREAFFTNFFDDAYNKTNFLNNLAYIFSSTTIQSELLSDYAGSVRLSIGSVITADSDEGNDTSDTRETEHPGPMAQEDELKRIVNGGGNFYLNAMLPVHSYAYNSAAFSELTTFNGRISSDIEGVGDNVDISDVKWMMLLSSYWAFSSDNKKFNFFLNVDYGWVTGSNDFVDRFGLQDVNVKPAFIGKAIAGVTLENKIRFTLTTKSFSNYKSMITDKVMVGVQLLN